MLSFGLPTFGLPTFGLPTFGLPTFRRTLVNFGDIASNDGVSNPSPVSTPIGLGWVKLG